MEATPILTSTPTIIMAVGRVWPGPRGNIIAPPLFFKHGHRNTMGHAGPTSSSCFVQE
jgi:hypothetical protein